MKPSELAGTRSLYRLTNRALAQIKELWQYAGEDELPPDSLLQAQVEALRILHIEVPLSAKRQFQLFCSDQNISPASPIPSTASLPIKSGLSSLGASNSSKVTDLMPKAPPSALVASVAVTSSSYSMIVPQVSSRTPMDQASRQRLAQSSPPLPGKISASP